MIKPNNQPLSLLVFVVLLVISSCRSQPGSSATTTSATEQTFSSTPPFQTREPERYQAKRTITRVGPSGQAVVTTNWLARDGQLRRDEVQEATFPRVVYLDLPEGRLVLLPDQKVYGDLNEQTNSVADEDALENSPDRVLHMDPIRTTYQNLGTESVNGRNTIKYRVVVNSSPTGSVSNTETFIWIDESLGMPVKSASTSSDGTKSTMELTDISTEVNGQLFKIPEGYQKLEAKELRRRLDKQ